MFGPLTFILADFTIPEELGTNPRSLLLLLPLVAAISVVYKTTKLPAVKALNFIRETAVLFASIVFIMVITGVVLLALSWFITQ